MCLDLIRERIISSMDTHVSFSSRSHIRHHIFLSFLLSTCTAGPKASLLSICVHDLPPGVCSSGGTEDESLAFLEPRANVH